MLLSLDLLNCNVFTAPVKLFHAGFCQLGLGLAVIQLIPFSRVVLLKYSHQATAGELLQILDMA